MKFWRFWNDLSLWNKVGLICVAAIVVLALFFTFV